MGYSFLDSDHNQVLIFLTGFFAVLNLESNILFIGEMELCVFLICELFFKLRIISSFIFLVKI